MNTTYMHINMLHRDGETQSAINHVFKELTTENK